MIKNRLLIFLIVFILMQNIESNEFFNSLGHMMQLAETFIKFIDDINKYFDKEDQRTKTVDNIMNELNDLAAMAKKSIEHFIGNPINCYLLIKYLVYNVEQMIQYTKNKKQFINFLNQVTETNKYSFPKEKDYYGALLALYRLEDTYLIKPRDFFNGNLSSIYPSKRLKSIDCFIIGNIAYQNKDYYHANNWLKVAYEEAKPGTFEKLKIIETYINSTIKEGLKRTSIKLLKEYLKQEPYNQLAKKRLNKLKDEMKKANLTKYELKIKSRKPKYLMPQIENFMALCRGEQIISSNSSLLKCNYNSKGPLLMIGPLKEELLSIDPLVYIYHDFITSKQAVKIKNMAIEDLKTSGIIGKDANGDFGVPIRVAKVSWLDDHHDQMFNYLSSIVTSATNLDKKDAEPWQVVNYGIGGQYYPHYDFINLTAEELRAKGSLSGNRVATWLVYLEEPEKGGSTVFPELKLQVKPKFGSAVLWYNLFRNGSFDFRTIHGSCPVLLGTKWVINKWYSADDQMFARKCDLSSDA